MTKSINIADRLLQSKFVSIVFLYSLTLQSFLRSFSPLANADNYSIWTKIQIFLLELRFMFKATVSLVFNINNREAFLGFTVVFGNYLEFVLLFIEIFAIQEYKLRSAHVTSIIDGGSNLGMSILYFILFAPKLALLPLSRVLPL